MAAELRPTGLRTSYSLDLSDSPQLTQYGSLVCIHKGSVPASTDTVMCRIDNCRGLIQVTADTGTEQHRVRWYRISGANSPKNHPSGLNEITEWSQGSWNNGALTVSFNNNSGNDKELIVNVVSYYGASSMLVTVTYFGGI